MQAQTYRNVYFFKNAFFLSNQTAYLVKLLCKAHNKKIRFIYLAHTNLIKDL